MHLKEAKKNLHNIENEITRLSKNEKALTKKEIANHREQLLNQIDESIEKIDAECSEIGKNIRNYKKQFEAKSVFLKRHNKRI